MISKIGLTMFVLATSGVTAADSMPKPGSYGFNWLVPTSQCKKLTDKDIKTFKKCTVSPNAFGLELSSHMCKVSAHVEFVVYKNAAECKEAFETMQANGD